jgi:hypothetical protein
MQKKKGPGDSKDSGTEIDNIRTDRDQKNGEGEGHAQEETYLM